ncbi:Uncharacterised protein [Enterobacter cloacae]|uniref:Uncharacterized protein n=1 Tax=Enterobacter cloacae TaxID=550 RepID=A0A377M144_ENTCL|nr:Uncharacterised protein [Enterobacter cloacae]
MLDEIPHPRSALFGIAGEEIAVEQRHAFSGVVENFPHPDVRVIHRNIEALDEADAKQLAGRPEYAIMQYVIERKIRLNLRLIQGIFRLTHTLGIKGPVPGLHGEAALLIINDFLDIGLFLHRTGARRRDNSTHKGQCGLPAFLPSGRRCSSSQSRQSPKAAPGVHAMP